METRPGEAYEVPTIVETLDAAEVVGWAEGQGCGSNNGVCIRIN